MRGWRRKRLIIWTTKQGLLKLGAAAALAVLTVFMLSFELPHSETWNYWTMPLSGKVIAVDAGHGGPDGGATSKEGMNEKDVNLAIAKHLRNYLQEAGAIVVMTREEDKDLAAPGTKGYSKRKTEDLVQRAKLIEKADADLMISIHLNSIPSPKWHGAQTFYHSAKPGGKILATLIQTELQRNLENTDRLAKENDTFYPMKAVSIPGALVEVGFLSHPEEARLMGQEGYQKKVAAAIYQGILRYCSGEQIGQP